MVFNRFYLISAILQAKFLNKTDEYSELLSIFYRLLGQEEISHKFIKEFYFYETLSNNAINFYINCKKHIF